MGIDRIKLLEEIRQALDTTEDIRPGADWMTQKEITDGLAGSRRNLYEKLNRLVEIGRMEKRRVGNKVYYRMVKNDPEME